MLETKRREGRLISLARHLSHPVLRCPIQPKKSLEPLFHNQLFLQSALFFLPLLHPSRHPAPTDGAGETTVPTAPAPSTVRGRAFPRAAGAY